MKIKIMREFTVDEAQANFTSIWDQVCQAGTQVVIKQPNGNDVVLMRLKDFGGMEETLDLLSSPANAKRLYEWIAQFKKFKG